MSFIRPVPWTRQPQFKAPFNRALGRPLVLINPAVGSRNLVDGSVWGASGAALPISVTTSGRSSLVTAISPAVSSVSVPAGANFTVVYFLPAGVVNTSQNSGVFRSATGGDTFCLIKTAVGGATNRPWVRLNTVDILNASTGPVVPNNRPVCLVFRVISANRVDVAWDGAVQHSATHSTSTPAFTFTAWGHQVNEIIGDCVLGAFLLDNAIPIAEISASPWQLFAPITRRIWVPQSGAAPAFLGAWARGSTTLIGSGLPGG